MSTIDKVKNALHLNKDHNTTTTGTSVPEGTAGPHSSRVANSTDPRVDSDLDNRRTAGTTTTGTTGTSGYKGTSTGVTGTIGTGSTNAGPHNSNLANKLDPTVDSGSRNSGTSTGAAGTTGTHSGIHAGNNTGNYTGTTGGLSNSTNAGPHDSNLANKLDPRVDSDLSGRGNRHGAAKGGIFGASGSHATPGSGTAQNTAGPHNSDLLNKVDPRVDSDADGSTTIGGNRTRAEITSQLDAAHVPPSVFAARHGEPEILHEDKTHDRAKRHSVISHQEQLSGV